MRQEVVMLSPTGPSTVPQREVVFPARAVAILPPAAVVTIGHFFGVVRRQIELQNQYPGQSFFVLDDNALAKDVASVNEVYFARFGPPRTVREKSCHTACCLLALGIDPRKTVMFRRSEVPQMSEFFVILATHCGGALQGGTTGFSAACLLALRGTRANVGSDQAAAVTTAAEVASRFNAFAEAPVLPVPELEATLTEPLPGIDGKPMSWGNAIDVMSPPNEISRVIQAAATGAGARMVERLTDLLMPRNQDPAATSHEVVAVALAQQFEQARNRYAYWQAQTDGVEDLLRRGAARARERASETLEEVRSWLGF